MKNKIQLIWGVTVGLVCLLTASQSVAADEATIVQLQGRVNIFSGAASKPQGAGPHVLYEGAYYHSQRARVGSKVAHGSVVQTGPGARVRIIYPNGDHFVVGQGSSYKLDWQEGGAADSGKQVADLKLYYGKVRAMVSPEGPHSQMRVRTQAAVAGVRGTDFFVSYFSDEGTELKVLRGEVVMKLNEPAAEETPIRAGFAAKVDAPVVERPLEQPLVMEPTVVANGDTPQVAPEVKAEDNSESAMPARKIQVAEVTKEELLDVQKISAEIQNQQSTAHLSQAQQQEQKQLLEKAAQAVLQDIRKDNPNIYDELVKDKHLSLNQISTKVVSDLYKAAPRAEVKQKPSDNDLHELGEGVYDKYFRQFDQ